MMSDKSLVYIEWVDACASGGDWEGKELAVSMKPKDCRVVGFVYAEDKDCVVLVQCDNDNAMINEICIPKVCIKYRKNLKV